MPRNFLYPHLLPPDVPVWEWFLDNHGHRYRRFEYDVRVGPGQQATGDIQARVKQAAFDLSRRRVDAVGFSDAGIDVIEITQRAGLKAIGQLTSYPILYQSTFGPLSDVRPVLVCEELLVGVDLVLTHLDIQIYLSGPLKSSTADD